MNKEFDFPTETVELPSKGLLYPASNPLSSGTVVIKYMTAREEDILTNRSYLEKGIVLDKLLKAVIVSEVNLDDLLLGDKNAILLATRILGYGKDYSFNYGDEEITVDLSAVDSKPLNEKLIEKGINEFSFNLPNSEIPIKFKILTHGDEKKISNELEGLKKINPTETHELTTRLKYIITEVNGSRTSKDIRDFISKHLLARDSRALREYIKQVQPDMNLTFFPDGKTKAVGIPIESSFFWPDSE